MPIAINAYPNASEAADAAARSVVEALSAAIAARGAASFAGAGGRTPWPVYERIAGADIDWKDVTVTLTDERWVAPTSPESNEGQLRGTLLTGRAAAARFEPLKSEVSDIAAGAADAARRLAPHLPLDMVLLGMGEDGHVASLFPGSPALDALGVVAVAPASDPAPPQERLSLTFGVLAEARDLILLVSGAAKRAILEADGDLPIHRLIRARGGRMRAYWWA